MIRKNKNVPRLPMGVSFTVAGDPGLRAAARRQSITRALCVGTGVMLVFGCAIGLTKLLAESQSFARSNSEQHGSEVESVNIVVASKRIEKGAKVDPADLREIRWPRDQVPEGAVREFKEAANLYATSSIPENLPVYLTALSTTPPAKGIQDLLPAGHRAITISVDSTTGIEGWATAGAHVDVMLTYMNKEDRTNVTQVIVENAIVLSYGGDARKDSDSEREVSQLEFTTVTLAVPFSESLKITTAIDMGRISLALRNSSDVMSAGDGVFSADEWGKKKAPLPAKPMNLPRGYARISTHDGEQKQFVLDEEKGWSNNQAEEFF